MISFLVTYYNQRNYVYDSLNSIFNTKLSDEYEVLVGDDGSSDGTLEEVEKWRNKFEDRLFVYVGDRGDGVDDSVVRASNLRKFLLRQSRGEYFCILDGDDYYCNQAFVQEATKILAKEVDISVVMFDYAMKYSKKTETRQLNIATGRIDRYEYIRDFYSPAGACVMRKPENDCFVNNLKSSLYYDDNDIVMYQLNFGDIWYIDQVIYMYRQHEDSIWHSLSRSQQGILNMLGADNEVLLAPKYSDDIYYRYRRDILYAYFRRARLSSYIGKMFRIKCLNLCKNKNFFLSTYFLSYEDNAIYHSDDSERVEAVIAKIKKNDPITYDDVKQNVEREILV